MQAAPETPVRTHHLRCVLYAIRTIFRVLPALGRETDHVNPPRVLSFKHFAIGGVICAVFLVGTIITIVRLVISAVV